MVGTEGRAGQPVTPLPSPDAPPLGGRALTVRGVGHDYALINTAAELSPDGTLLAFLRADRPFVRHLPSGVEAPLFTGRMRDVHVRFVGFAPDSRRSAYTVSERQTMEGPPSIFPIPAGAWVATVSLQGPPEGVRSTAPVLRVASNTRLERAGADDTLSFWSADGTALLGRAHEAQYVETLRRTPVDGGAPTALHSVRAYLGMIQLHPRGDRAVFQYTPLDARNRPGQTSLATLPLSPSATPVAPRVLVPLRSSNAGPELSPDASQVAYTDLDAGGAAQLYVVSAEGGAAPRALHPCRTRCDFTGSPTRRCCSCTARRSCGCLPPEPRRRRSCRGACGRCSWGAGRRKERSFTIRRGRSWPRRGRSVPRRRQALRAPGRWAGTGRRRGGRRAVAAGR